MKLTDFNTDDKYGYLTADANTTKNDLIEVCALTGEGLIVGNTDFAAVGNVSYGTSQTSAATGQVIAHTTIIAGQTTAYGRQAMIINSTDFLFAVSTYSTTSGVKLTKYSSAGVLVNSVDIDTTATATYNHQLILLSNGDLCVLYSIGSVLKYAIYDNNLVVVKSLTSIVGSLSSDYWAATGLSGGGFAAVYQVTGTPLESRLVTFNNAGTAVLSATAVWTRTGTTGLQYHTLTQLSSGNLAYAISSANTVACIGLWYGVTDTSGSIVQAFTVLDTTSQTTLPELVSNGAGYFAIARPNGTNQLAWVFSNAGAVQGAGFTAATAAGSSNLKTKLVASSTTMYLIWARSSDTKEVVSALPITGTGYTTGVVTTTTTQYNFYIDAFYEDGYIVGTALPGTAVAPQVWVISAANLALVNLAGTTYGTAPSAASGSYPRIMSVGDRTFVAMYDYNSTAGTFFTAGKWASTAVIGVAAATTTAASAIPLHVLTGAYKINSINGTKAKAFDMTATTLAGNKGTMLASGSVILTGI